MIRYIIDRTLMAAIIFALTWLAFKALDVYENVKIMNASAFCMQYNGNKWDSKLLQCHVRADDA